MIKNDFSTYNLKMFNAHSYYYRIDINNKIRKEVIVLKYDVCMIVQDVTKYWNRDVTWYLYDNTGCNKISKLDIVLICIKKISFENLSVIMSKKYLNS